MEVKIISKECIKPSSPTPPNLKTHRLSLLDQFSSFGYIPVIFFYPMNQSISNNAAVDHIVSQRSHSLKQSLSEILTRFYPFAGKIKDHLSIDCNDEGVFYLEAYLNCHLVDCLRQPNIASFEKFLPRESWKGPTEGDHVAMIKVTTFACGGIAIGVLVSHMIADGISLSVFLKDWAATARKASEKVVCPNFDASSIFIQNGAYSREAIMTALSKPCKSGRCIVRRIVFDASAIASLKANATRSSVQNPTRVEVVSAFLWKCTMTAFKATSGIQRPTFITHAVNLRRRANPPFTESSIGNILWGTGELCTADEIDLICMVSKLREAITKVNVDFVKNLQGDGGFFKLWELVKARTGAVSSMAFSCGMDYIGFTSWCNFGVYDIDFGWEKPMWVSLVGATGDSETVFRSRIYLMDTRSGNGIEAWVLLDKEDMTMLAQDQELLAFASLDPSPIE
ncbi:stemmadenine O-acetyltransferase-like [Corylus avellana]|uniref:stemmadenine O-acetyltransferase-like n=1 Tax=Corylus avellana TaxID=13451 RepID=UPI00286A051E|nr:stemmadenine O-acetyltransferase-like [Corylus avellana]